MRVVQHIHRKTPLEKVNFTLRPGEGIVVLLHGEPASEVHVDKYRTSSARWCPACKSLLSLLEDVGIRYVFVDISRCGGDEYRKIVEMFSLEPAVPLSVVFTELGWPGYIILSAVLDTEWRKSLSRSPRTDLVTVFDAREARKANASLAPELVEIVKRSLSSCATATSTTATGGAERAIGPSLTSIEVVAIAGVAVAAAA